MIKFKMSWSDQEYKKKLQNNWSFKLEKLELKVTQLEEYMVNIIYYIVLFGSLQKSESGTFRINNDLCLFNFMLKLYEIF